MSKQVLVKGQGSQAKGIAKASSVFRGRIPLSQERRR